MCNYLKQLNPAILIKWIRQKVVVQHSCLIWLTVIPILLLLLQLLLLLLLPPPIMSHLFNLFYTSHQCSVVLHSSSPFHQSSPAVLWPDSGSSSPHCWMRNLPPQSLTTAWRSLFPLTYSSNGFPFSESAWVNRMMV